MRILACAIATALCFGCASGQSWKLKDRDGNEWTLKEIPAKVDAQGYEPQPEIINGKKTGAAIVKWHIDAENSASCKSHVSGWMLIPVHWQVPSVVVSGTSKGLVDPGKIGRVEGTVRIANWYELVK